LRTFLPCLNVKVQNNESRYQPATSTGKIVIDLYHAPAPNGWKISIMLEELGFPYKVARHSGARRSREPGIHQAAMNVAKWIPGSRLRRRAPE
jgi:hypothetical protein